MIIKAFESYSIRRCSNQVLRKPVKLLNSQNVNCWSRCEFIRLRIQYGTEIFKEIEYHSIETIKAFRNSVCEASFFDSYLNKFGEFKYPIVETLRDLFARLFYLFVNNE